MNTCCTFSYWRGRLTVCYCERVCASLDFTLLGLYLVMFYTRCLQDLPKLTVSEVHGHVQKLWSAKQFYTPTISPRAQRLSVSDRTKSQSCKIQLSCSVTMGTAFKWKEANNSSAFGQIECNNVWQTHLFETERSSFRLSLSETPYDSPEDPSSYTLRDLSAVEMALSNLKIIKWKLWLHSIKTIDLSLFLKEKDTNITKEQPFLSTLVFLPFICSRHVDLWSHYLMLVCTKTVGCGVICFLKWWSHRGISSST